MDLTVWKCKVGDTGLLKVLENSQPLIHPHTSHKLGADKYITTALELISNFDGFEAAELDAVLLEEGFTYFKVCIWVPCVTYSVPCFHRTANLS